VTGLTCPPIPSIGGLVGGQSAAPSVMKIMLKEGAVVVDKKGMLTREELERIERDYQDLPQDWWPRIKHLIEALERSQEALRTILEWHDKYDVNCDCSAAHAAILPGKEGA